MRAIAVNPNTRALGIIDHPEPSITSPFEVKLRMLEAGVCGTDREICAFEYGTPPAGSDHLVIGHESVGQVLEVGKSVSRVRVGDIVIPMVRRPCPHASCVACRTGRQDFCLTGDFTERGIKEAHGFMTEVVVDDERYMNGVPGALRDVAVLVEPLTIAEKALIQVAQVQDRLPWCAPGASHDDYRRHAVVLGAGPVGLLGAMPLVAAGYETYVYSRDAAGSAKARLTEAIGAHYVPSESTTIADLAKTIGNIDLVFEATGASQLSFEVLQSLGINSVFVFTGVPGRRGPIEVDADLLMRNLVLKNQIVFGTVNAGRDAFEAAIRDLGHFMDRWPATVRSLITGRFGMDEHRELLLGKPTGIKNVIRLAA